MQRRVTARISEAVLDDIESFIEEAEDGLDVSDVVSKAITSYLGA